jgi:hypothetical protein
VYKAEYLLLLCKFLTERFNKKMLYSMLSVMRILLLRTNYYDSERDCSVFNISEEDGEAYASLLSTSSFVNGPQKSGNSLIWYKAADVRSSRMERPRDQSKVKLTL